MELTVRCGTEADIDELASLYDTLNDYLETHTNYCGWKKGIYPTREDAEAGISEGCLYVAVNGGRIAGSLILRHTPEEAYKGVSWQEELPYEKVFVIYTFAVHPQVHNMGVASRLLEFTEEKAAKEGVRALRLDVYEKNLPAMRLYEKHGYKRIATVDLGLAQYGLERFALYEKVLLDTICSM